MKYLKYIFSPKTKMLTRKEYWKFFAISLFLLIILLFLGNIISNNYSYGFSINRYYTFLCIIFLISNVILQIKRLRDANISPYLLIVYFLSILSVIFDTYSFIYVMYVILLILLLMPSQKPYTANLTKEK